MAIAVGSRVWLTCSTVPLAVIEIAGIKAHVWWIDNDGHTPHSLWVLLSALKETKPTGV